MKAFIIFMNDEPKKVVLDDQKALEEAERMSEAFYKTIEQAHIPLS